MKQTKDNEKELFKDVTQQKGAEYAMVNARILEDYDADMSSEEFKTRYAGVFFKDNGKRLKKSSMQRIWNKFVRQERIDFFSNHTNLKYYDLIRVGVDKFIVTMGWTKPSHVSTWKNNRVRIGICCDCNDQFIPMMFQTNHGLCNNCRPSYSVKAMRNFVLKQLHQSERYDKAYRDMLMDFYIVFYHDAPFRELFKKGTDSANELESLDLEVPEWVHGPQAERFVEEALQENSENEDK